MVENSQDELRPIAGNEHGKTVCVSVWIVYTQAALLGLIAVTFFIFGMLVGRLTFSTESKKSLAAGPIEVSGSVMFSQNGKQFPDQGAVVLLLPSPPADIQRFDPNTLHPARFEPLENPAIDWIRKQGGDVVRANIDGYFQFFARPARYDLLVVSNRRTNQKIEMTKDQFATLSQFFLPVEPLAADRQFHWFTFTIDDSPVRHNVEF